MRVVVIFTVIAFCGLSVDAFRLPTFFSDNMVLQGTPLTTRIWGWGSEETVKVSFAEFVGMTTVVNGTWMVELNDIPHGGPHDILITYNIANVTLKNVMIGDVFLCSGQSNMQMPIAYVFNATDEIADSINYPNLRIFTATPVWSPTLLDDANSSAPYIWGISSPEIIIGGETDWHYVSAVCYLFGRDLIRADESRIVGLVISSL